MPGKRITELTAIAGASTANDDNLVIFDTSEGTTKRILRSQLAAGLVGDLPYTPAGFIAATTVPTAIAEIASDLSASSGSSLVGFVQSGTGAVAQTLQGKGRTQFHVNDFGAVGDDTNETTKLINALTAAAGNTLVFAANKTYRATDALVVPANTSLELNNSTIKFVITGDKNCLDLRSGVSVRNGAIELAGSSYTGHGGNGCPIVVGDYGIGTGYNNIELSGLSITSNKTDGNGIVVTGDSTNICIRNLEIVGPNNLGCAVLAHWGGANNPSAGTTHPNKIIIENVKCGTMSLATGLGITLSGAYDVTVNNVTFENTAQHALYVFCGDYGMLYATDANVKAHGVHNIKITNVTGKRVGYAVYVDMYRNLAPAPAKETCRNIVFENCSFYGNAPTTSTKFGARLRYAENITFKECIFENFYQNVVLSLSSSNNTFQSCQFLSSRVQAVVNYVSGETSATPSTYNQFIGCLFKNSNQSATASIADINLQWGGQNLIDNCRFDSALTAQNVRIEGSTNSSYGNSVVNNQVVTAPTSVCFSFGASTDFNLVTMFAQNRMVNNSAVPTNGFTGGQLHLPFDSTPRAGQNRVAFKMVGAAVPTGGLWTVGDTIFFNAPAAGGNIGAVCVTEGTPGTWKTFGAIAV